VAAVPHELDGATASTGFTVLRANDTSLSARYLYHWLKTPSFIDDMVKKATGQSYPAVSDRIVLESLIPLPRIEEQRRIAAILDQAEALRAKRRQALAKLDTLTQSLFLKMFGDPLSNPQNWPVHPLGEVASFENGDRSSNYPSGDDIQNQGVVFLNGKNIVDDRLDLTSSNFISQEKFDSLARGKARNGDLIITLRGTLGSCCIFTSDSGKAFINAQMMIIRPPGNVLSEYLHALVTSARFKANLQQISSGVAVPQLTSAQLRELPIMLPPREAQDRFLFQSRLVNNLRVGLIDSMLRQDGLASALQHQAFQGDL
jgi:type I restriction enzyme S subunit